MSAKNVLITGANKGIGRATVHDVLREDPDTFVFLGSRDIARGEEARDELVADEPSWSQRLEVVQLDVADDGSVADAAEFVAQRFDSKRPLYGIVNNAGVGQGDMAWVLDVNTRGARRVCQAFVPLIGDGGRVVSVSSASGPNFVAACDPERQEVLTSPDVTWAQIEALMEECLAIEAGDGDFESRGLGEGSAYGLSKACLNAYTIAFARENPSLTINACTPGFIHTDLTQRYLDSRDATPKELGMKPPNEGTRAQLHLLLGQPGGSGWYFGSDAERSPLDRYRSPGDPPFTGD